MLKNILFILLVPAIFFSTTDAHSTDLKVIVLDVGMGQSVLLTRNGHGLLIDTGLAESTPLVLSRMNYYGVQKLDYLILSHLHPDHTMGYFQIRGAWPDTPVLGNCHVPEKLHPEEEGSFGKVHAALSRDPLYGCLAAGNSISWQGLELQVLWPVVAKGSPIKRPLVKAYISPLRKKCYFPCKGKIKCSADFFAVAMILFDHTRYFRV